jgi:hypothetical protein
MDLQHSSSVMQTSFTRLGHFYCKHLQIFSLGSSAESHSDFGLAAKFAQKRVSWACLHLTLASASIATDDLGKYRPSATISTNAGLVSDSGSHFCTYLSQYTQRRSSFRLQPYFQTAQVAS